MVVGAAVVVGAGAVEAVEAVVGEGGGSLKITPGSPAVVGVRGVAVVGVAARPVMTGPGPLDVVDTMPGGTGAAVSGRAAVRSTVEVGSATVTAAGGAVAVASPVLGARRSRFAVDTNAIRLMPAAANKSLLTRAARLLAYHHSRIQFAGCEPWNAPYPMPAER